MEAYSMPYQVRWSDIDANRHVNYAAYIEAATELRYRFFAEQGIAPETFENLHIGPTYTSLQVNFFREVRLGETLTITFWLAGMSESVIRWRIRHDFLKANGKKAVALTLEGTFLDLEARKPVLPTPQILHAFHAAPRSADFEVMPEVRWFK